ncbi:MAG: gliding motility-associated C-terminal domain-containing protein [Chitinophagales bacterium]|nr:gliding motility-associated C-terminal domain-containing protein [Chitinophagales bacterium]
MGAISPTPSGGRHTLATPPGVDPYGLFPIVSPNGGNFALKLGNNSVGSQAESAVYYIRVPNTTNSLFTLIYRYAVVFQDPAHAPSMQPRFVVNVYDSATGNPIPCNQFTFVSSSSLPGFKQSTVSADVYYKDWTNSTIDLSSLGGTTVAVEFTTGDCGHGGHFGYGYVDVTCELFETFQLYCNDVPTITLKGPPGFQTYEWRDSSSGSLVGYGENITIPTPSTTTTFAVILSPYTGFGCPDTIYTTFFTVPMLSVTSKDTAICPKDSAHLHVIANSTATPLSYSWTPTTGLSCINCQSPMAAPTTDTKYYVSITDTNGCKHRDSIEVEVTDGAKADIDIPKDTICMYEPITLKNLGTTDPIAQYLWNVQNGKGSIITGQGTPNITVKWDSTGTKQIRLFVVNGVCSDSATGSLEVKYAPNAEFDIQKDICIGQPVQLWPYKDDAKYFWEIDEQSITDNIFKDRYDLTWNTLGNKHIKLTLIHDNKCQNTHEKTVSIHDYPEAKIVVADIGDICTGKQFSLSAKEEYRYEYSWSPPQYFGNSHNATVTGIAERSGNIVLTVSNEWNCFSQDSIYLDVPACCEIIMPTAFSPNKDGHNDIFRPVNKNGIQVAVLMIANRRGQIVYDVKDTNTGWDGNYKDKPAGQDTYNYYVKYLCEDGTSKEKKGTFVLLR